MLGHRFERSDGRVRGGRPARDGSGRSYALRDGADRPPDPDRGTQIGNAIRGFKPEPSPDPRLSDLLSVAIFGQQGGFFFIGVGDIPNTDTPEANSLVSLQAALPVLDQTLARIKADLTAAGLDACWPT